MAETQKKNCHESSDNSKKRILTNSVELNMTRVISMHESTHGHDHDSKTLTFLAASGLKYRAQFSEEAPSAAYTGQPPCSVCTSKHWNNITCAS